MTGIPELTDAQLARAIPARVRKRLIAGQIESGKDVAALRRFVGLTQSQFAEAMAISVHTLRNWEQGRRRPEGPDRVAENCRPSSQDHSRKRQVSGLIDASCSRLTGDYRAG